MVQDYPAAIVDLAIWSPTDAKIAYVLNHDVYVHDMATSNTERVTFDGGEKTLYDAENGISEGFIPNLLLNLMRDR